MRSLILVLTVIGAIAPGFKYVPCEIGVSTLETFLLDEFLVLGVSPIGGVIRTTSFILDGRMFLVSQSCSVSAHTGNQVIQYLCW